MFAAWLQNLLGNVITFNKLYEKIEEAKEAGNMREIYYWYGRFATLFINFDPIEEDPFEDGDDADFSEILLFADIEPSMERQSRVTGSSRVSQPRVRGTVSNVASFTSGFMNASLG